MRPWPLKKWEMSFPLSANRAVASAETGLAGSRAFFIQSDLLPSRLPQRDQMQNLALFVLPDQLLRLLEPDASPGIHSKALALLRIEAKRMARYDCYTTKITVRLAIPSLPACPTGQPVGSLAGSGCTARMRSAKRFLKK